MDDEPTPPATSEPTPIPPSDPGRTDLARQVVLGVVVFAATLVVLIGLTGIIGRSPAPSATPEAAATTAAPTPTAPASTAATAAPVTASPTPAASPSQSASASPSEAATPAASGPIGDPVLVGAGDISVCSSDGDVDTARLLDDIEGTVFTAGDNAYDRGSTKDYRDCYDPTWGRHKDRTWPVAGNHDWDTRGLAGYREYFGDAAGADGTSWYAKDLGTWRVIVLDSNCSKVGGCKADSPQGRWLADELATHQATCTLVLFHHPRFSSGDQHGNDRGMDAFWRPLYAAGVDVIVNGHDHDYERFAPQDPDAKEDRERGIREFVVGTGGASLRGFNAPEPNSELRASVTHGVLALTLHPDSYDWEFHPTDTDFSDRGSGPCHA